MPNTGYLLINLGTPASPAIKDVRAYLNEFLMDPHVLDVPWPLRRLIVSGFILPFRPKQSAQAYASIWSDAGSPLLLFSEAIRRGLEAELAANVALGMRYGRPSIASALEQLVQQGVQQIVVVPLYPQYADSTVATSVVQVNKSLAQDIEHSFISPFYDDPGYINALAGSVSQALPQQWDHLLLSYHGLPEQHMTKADPTGSHCLKRADCCEVSSTAHATCYRHQVYATSRALAQKLGLNSADYSVSFQSRLGRLPWLRPYTDRMLAELPERGVKHLAVACPAFVADNLETLEEMGIRGRQTFLQAGGESFHLLPCLNDSEQWIKALAGIVRRHTQEHNEGYNDLASSETSA